MFHPILKALGDPGQKNEELWKVCFGFSAHLVYCPPPGGYHYILVSLLGSSQYCHCRATEYEVTHLLSTPLPFLPVGVLKLQDTLF